MLDFSPFAEVNLDALKQAAWERAVGKKPHLGGFRDYNPDPGVELRSKSGFIGGLHKFSEQANPGHYLQDLGLEHDIFPTEEEIRKAFGRLSKRHHPDIDQQNPEAAKYFDQLKNSYEKVKDLRQHVEQVAKTQAEKLKEHFSTHSHNLGWRHALESDNMKIAYFPCDHLTNAQQQELMATLKEDGNHNVKKQLLKFSGGICNDLELSAAQDAPTLFKSAEQLSSVITVTRYDGKPITAEEVAQKLLTRFKPLPIPETTIVQEAEQVAERAVMQAAEESETKTASALKNVAKAAEEAAEKSGSKAKWIIGGIVAAAVAVGAFIVLKKKTPAEYQKDHQKNNTLAQGIG